MYHCCISHSFVLSFFFLITFLSLLLILLITELNPGPRKDIFGHNFSIPHWNVNTIAAQNFIKIGQLDPYNTIHSYDLIFLCETRLDDLHRLQ